MGFAGALLSGQGGSAAALLTDDPADEDHTYTPTYLGLLVTTEEWFRLDDTLIKSIEYEYTSGLVSTVVVKVFAADGTTIIAQTTSSYSYTGIVLDEIVTARDV